MAHLRKKQQAYRYGIRAEYLVILLLVMKGYRILARRYKTPVGEIDIIAKRWRTIAFIEVKARKNPLYLYEALSNYQETRIMEAARYFIQRYPRYSRFIRRFDLVTVERYTVKHITH
jgi:putative endonuclease